MMVRKVTRETWEDMREEILDERNAAVGASMATSGLVGLVLFVLYLLGGVFFFLSDRELRLFVGYAGLVSLVTSISHVLWAYRKARRALQDLDIQLAKSEKKDSAP